MSETDYDDVPEPVVCRECGYWTDDDRCCKRREDA